MVQVDAKQLFSNISEILEANRTLFWAAHLLPMLERSRASGKPLKPALMRNAFVQVSTDCGATTPRPVRPIG